MFLGDTYGGTRPARAARGLSNYHAGLTAESIVERKYERAGYRVVARRWRGRAGEIDLIVARDGGFAFVEVKASKTYEAAAMMLGPRQQRRIATAASEFLATADPDGRSEARIDVALVNQWGRTKFLQNAIGY